MGKRIGIVGYGLIGSYLVRQINLDKDLSMAFVHDVDAQKLSELNPSLVIGSIEEAKERKADLIVEVANSHWVEQVAPVVLEFADLLIVSVSALATEGLPERLNAIATTNETRFYVSHGAIFVLSVFNSRLY